MLDRKLNKNNPFDWVVTQATNWPDFSLEEFAKRFLLSINEAKIIWLSAPQFQEDFCRNRLSERKERGASGVGAKIWLRRRYNLSEEEIEAVFADIWNNPSDQISNIFLQIITPERIAKSQLTSDAQQELAGLLKQYGLAEYPSVTP
jgi:hypothetical protein